MRPARGRQGARRDCTDSFHFPTSNQIETRLYQLINLAASNTITTTTHNFIISLEPILHQGFNKYTSMVAKRSKKVQSSIALYLVAVGNDGVSVENLYPTV